MDLKLIVILLGLSLTSCKCGLLNWFSEWTDKLDSQNAKIKCREKRKTEENGIKPDITKATADKRFSLMDIEVGKPTTKYERKHKTKAYQENLKAKKYLEKRFIVTAKNPMVGAARKKFLPYMMSKASSPEERCDACTSRPPCRLLGQCAHCNEDCKNIAIFTDDLLRPWTNQTVGMVHRMNSPNKSDMFSKTLYPMATFTDGETKDIICRIVGITNASDIETITIWVTTFSNTPPKSSNSMKDDPPGTPKKVEDDSKIQDITPQSLSTDKEPATSPYLQPRFSEDDDESGSTKVKANPDLIEGPPPFLGSDNEASSTEFSSSGDNNLQDNDISSDKTTTLTKPIVVQPKEFEDSSDEDDSDDDTSSSVPSSRPVEKLTTTKNIVKPTLLNRLRELAASRINKLSDLTDRRQKAENDIQKNILSPYDTTKENSIISTPSSPNSFQEPVENIVAANENQNTPIRLPGESDDQITKIGEAIEEVKSMVKNIQEETSKASEKRLLGASQIPDTTKDVAQNDIPAEDMNLMPDKKIHQELPNNFVDNMKKVNNFFINRAQDALDMIGRQEKKGDPSQLAKVGGVRDEHSEITKDTITNFKKMPQFLLERFKDSFNGFEKKQESNSAKEVETNSIKEDATTWGTEDKVDLEEKLTNTDNKIDSLDVRSDDNRDESLVGITKQNILENETSPNIETPTTKSYKNKLEKYLAEVKEKRQRLYSPDKYIKSPSTKTDNLISLAMEEGSTNLVGSTTKNLDPSQNEVENISDKSIGSNIPSPKDFEKQTELLRQKLRNFINDVKLKASLPLTTVATTPSLTKKVNDMVPTDTQNINADELLEQPNLNDNSLKETSETNSDFPHAVPNKNADQIVGESNIQGVNDINFFPTIPTLPSNEISPDTKKPNKFLKYLEDLRSKQSLLLKPKSSSDPTFLQNRMPALEPENHPNEISDQVSNLNNKVKNDMKNLFVSTPNVFKKDLLKDKLRDYVDSLRKPLGSKSIPVLARKSSEAQKEELNSLRKKLESLLKAKEPTPLSVDDNSSDSKEAPNLESSDVPDVDQNMVPYMKTTEMQNNAIVGDINHSAMDIIQQRENQNTLEANGKTIKQDADVLDWSHSLGKIVQSSSQPKDIFFLGSGIKLPLQVTQGPNGSMDLSVDLEKLCSCYNATCPKNHTAIEETVGAILEKEAELNEQLNSETLDDVKIKPIIDTSPVTKPVADGINFEKKRPYLSNRNTDTLRIRKRKSNIFKRSSDIRGLGQELTTIKTVLEKLKKKNKVNMRNNALKNSDLPKLPTLDEVADELTNLGKNIQDSFTNSVQQLKNNVEELKDELENTIVGASENKNLLVNQDLPEIPTYNSKQFQDNLDEMKEKIDEINNNVMEKLEHENALNNLLNINGLKKYNQANSLKNVYPKNLNPDKMYRQILKANNNKLFLSTENPLNQIKNQANNVINSLEPQNIINKLTENTGFNRFNLPKVPPYSTTNDPFALINQFQEKLEESIPTIPELQDRMNEINDNVVKITDSYQFGKADILESKLRQLDNEIKKYYENNKKLLTEESKKIFGGHNNEIVEKELNIINRIISWIKSLASGINV